MKLQHIDLAQLKPSPLNVRKHGGEEELPELIASIRSIGVIQPLPVRQNCEGYDVIAGQRRLLACRAIAAEDGAAEPVPCAILEDGDDAKAIEASLAENIARLPMDEIDQYEAFAAILAQGRSVADIASQFGVTELLVNRRLAIARRLDLGELSRGIVGDDRFGLLQEGGKRLGWSAAHEGRELLDELGPRGIDIGRETPRKDALDDHLGHAAKALGH